MIADIEAGKVGYMITKDLSRQGNSREDSHHWSCMRIAKQLMDDKVLITRVKANTKCDMNYYS